MSRKVLLQKIFDEYREKGGDIDNLIPKIEKIYSDVVPIDEPSFEILNVRTERSMTGSTEISARCIQDETLVTVTIINDNRTIVRETLIYAYNKITKNKACKGIQPGDII